MESEYRKRRERLKRIIDELHVDALLITSLVNARYLCGFTGSNGFLLIAENHEILFTDSRYIEQGSEETFNEIDVSLSPGFKGLTGPLDLTKLTTWGSNLEM